MGLSDLFSIPILLLIVGIFGVIWAIRKTSVRLKAKWLNPVRLTLWKVLWLIPIALGVVGAIFLPDLFEGDGLGVRILKGMFAGFCAVFFRKAFKRVFLEKFGVDISVDNPGLDEASTPLPTLK